MTWRLPRVSAAEYDLMTHFDRSVYHAERAAVLARWVFVVGVVWGVCMVLVLVVWGVR